MAIAGPDRAIVFRKAAPAVFLMIYAVGALIYGNSLLTPFYGDDLPVIAENPHIRLTRLTGTQLDNTLARQPVSRFLPMLTFTLNYFFNRYRIGGYHLVNILIHIINGWLVFCLAWQTSRLNGIKPFSASLLAGLLWLTQPTHTQSVTYIVQRINSLAAMFYLLAMVCYIQGRRRQRRNAPANRTAPWFAGCVLAGLMGLVSKQIVATLPAFIFLYEWFFFQNLDRVWLKRRWRWPALAAALCALVAWLYLGGQPLEQIARTYARQPFTTGQRLLTQPGVIAYYLSLLAWPDADRLTLHYDFPLSRSLTDPASTLLSLAALAALLILAADTARKHRLLAFTVFWFLGNLLIESSVIGLALVFEHRVYLPSVFPAIAATICLRRHITPRPLAIAFLSGLIACNGFWTYQRNDVWQDRIPFWRDGCAKAPGLTTLRNDLGLALAEADDRPAAVAEYEKALALAAGDKAPVYNNLGLLYYQNGQPDAAERQFVDALQAQPTFAKAFMNLGIIKAEKGNLAEAIRLLETAVILDPDDSNAHSALGKFYYEAKRPEAAIGQCRRALELDPENINAENNLGAIFLGVGDTGQALACLNRVLQISPDHLEAHINIGIAYGRLNAPVMALFHLFRAVFLAPDYPAAHAELGIMLLKNEKYPDAQTQLEKALALQPDFLRARLALAAVLARQDKKNEAIAEYQKIIAGDPGQTAARQQLDMLLHESGKKADE